MPIRTHMWYEHYCVFCGDHASSETLVADDVACARCGGTLRACPATDHPRIEAALNRERAAHRPALDGVGPLAILIAAPFLAPLAGLDVREAIFAVPVIFLALAAAMAVRVARRPREPATAWRLYALAAAVLTVAWVPALRGAASGAGALLLVLGLLAHLPRRLAQGLRRDALVNAVPGVVAVPAVALVLVLIPGFGHGDVLLTLVVAANLLAFGLAGVLQAGGRRAQDGRIGRRLWAVCTATLAAAAMSAAQAAGSLDGIPAREIAAALYAVAGWVLAAASVAERPAPKPAGTLLEVSVSPPLAAEPAPGA